MTQSGGNSPKNKSHGRLAISQSLRPRELMQDRPDLALAWRAHIITLFPDAFPGVLGQSLTGKALSAGLWSYETFDLRRYGRGKHRNVDDTPAGGGAGMVLRADVLSDALVEAAKGTPQDRSAWPIIYLSPRGRRFEHATAQRLAKGRGATLICGRFEGVDERVLEAWGVEELSLGDFVMSGGEIAAQAVIDASLRFIPGVLGNEASAQEESFSIGLLEHPHYTKPALWEGRAIPEVLLSGNHQEIAKWRQSQAKAMTQNRRPDLWQAYKAKDQSDQ